MKTKRILAIVLAMMMLFSQVVSVCAEETGTTEWYELVEEDFEMVSEPEQQITPYSLYLMNVMIRVSKGTPMRTLKISYKTTNSCQEMV